MTTEVQLLRESDKLKEANRKEKIKTVASRTSGLLMESNMFFATFIGKHNSETYRKLMEDNFNKHDLPDSEIIEIVRKVFMSTTMLEPSHVVMKPNNASISELDFFLTQSVKIYSEANTILQHYGDIDHELIKQLDEIRSRSKELSQIIPTLNSIPGGVKGVFGNGVTEQYAGFFAYFYLALHKCDIKCKSILNDN